MEAGGKLDPVPIMFYDVVGDYILCKPGEDVA
jgi:hypothetical protein